MRVALPCVGVLDPARHRELVLPALNFLGVAQQLLHNILDVKQLLEPRVPETEQPTLHQQGRLQQDGSIFVSSDPACVEQWEG